MRVWRDGMPDQRRGRDCAKELTLDLLESPEAPLDAAHIFVTERAKLERELCRLLPLLGQSGFIWVSWPKKASKVPTDITEDTIREVCLPMGWST